MRGRGIVSGIVVLALGVACGDDGSGAGTDTDASTAATMPTTTAPCVTDCTSSTDPSTGTAPTTDPSEGSTASTTAPEESSGGSSTGEPVMGPLRLYVSGGGGITVWDVDDATGALTSVETVDLMTEVGPLAIDPSNNFLYAALTQQESVQAFSIDQTTGALTDIDTTGVGHFPVYLAVDRTGNWLFTADFGADLMEVYPIDDAGAVGDTASESRSTSARPHAIFSDDSNQFVFVPCRDAALVEQYVFDETTGTVTPNDPATASAPGGTGPRHLVIHPDGTQAYLAGEFNSTINVFDYDAVAGTMTFVEALSSLPEGFNGENTTADIHVTPDGSAVYISNRGHDSLAMFGVGGGTLTPLGHAPTEPRPREFGLTPYGRHVYAAGQDSGMLASYVVQGDGTLVAGKTYAVGSNPLWVVSAELPPG